jgi:hypothetical protein
MKRIFAFLTLILVAAQSAHAATPQPSPTLQSFCTARKPIVTALDGQLDARTFAVTVLSGTRAGPGPVSGMLTLYAGASRYDIPIHNFEVTTTMNLDTVKPLVVRFPSPVRLDAAYLSSIDGPNGGPCDLTSGLSMFPQSDTAYTKRALASTPVDAPPPVNDPAPCDKPYVDAHVLKFAGPGGPPDPSTSDEFGGAVRIMVHLAPDGSIIDLVPLPPRAAPDLENAALAMARASTYAPQVVRCKPIDSIYVYVAKRAP